MSGPANSNWPLAQPVPETIVEQASAVKSVIFDVDGVLTDGGLYFGPNGEEYKRFSTLDGHGLKLLRDTGIEIALITARTSPALDARVRELGITNFYSGRQDKLAAFNELHAALGVEPGQCCYVGDDLVDLPIMVRCGLAIAVANANHIVKRVAHWVTATSGGAGAVREVCELIMYAQGHFDAAVEAHLK